MRTQPIDPRAADRFPFPSSFQFRSDETRALEALFARALFAQPFNREDLAALDKIRYPAEPGQRTPQGGDDDEANRQPASVSSGEASDPGPRHVILCRGANGIGKTRIFRCLRERARAQNVAVCEVYNYDVEGIPLKPFLFAIRQIIAEQENGGALLERYRYALESLIPGAFGQGVNALGRAVSTADSGLWARAQGAAQERFLFGPRHRLDAERVRVFEGITQLLLEAASRRPLLILVQDLHWGDRGTVELLRYIGRNVQLRNQAALVRGQSAQAAAARRSGLNPAEAAAAANGLETEDLGEDGRPLTSHGKGPGAAASRPPDADVSTATLVHADESPRPVRLLVLANYRPFADDSHYIQQAIDSLGQEPFAFHAELLPLSRQEAAGFMQRAVSGVSVRVGSVEGDFDGGGSETAETPDEIRSATLEVCPEAVDEVFGLSEGFPSFQQELFRGVYLSDSTLRRWEPQTFRSYLETASPPEPSEPAAAEKPSTSPVRHAILRRRLADASALQLRVLQVLSLGRRPVRPEFVQRVLVKAAELEANEANDAAVPAGTGGAEGLAGPDAELSEASIDAVFTALEDRGLVEYRSGCEPVSPLDPGGYYFRLWDYTDVVEETISAPLRRRLHQCIGEECIVRVESEHRDGLRDDLLDDGAYEIYHHLSRGRSPQSALSFGRLATRRFVRCFALEKARLLCSEIADVLKDQPDLLRQRIEVLENLVRISASLKDGPRAEEVLRQIYQEGAEILSPEDRFEVQLLEAEVAGEADPARGLKILGKATRLVRDENCAEAARLYLAVTRLRLARQDWKRAINFGLKGIGICQKLDRAAELGAFYQLMARAFYKKGDYSHAVDNYERGFEAAERTGDRALMVDILDEIGRVYLERGNHFRSGRYLYKALEMRRRDNDVAGLCRSYDQLGLVYRRDGDYHKTIENLNRSLILKERIGDHAALNPTLGTLGDLYFRLGYYGRAVRYFRREVENTQRLKGQHKEASAWLADAFVRLGWVYLEVGDLKQAESFCKQAVILASEFKHRSQEADGLMLSGNIKAFHREWTAAEKELRQALEAYGKLGHRMRETCALLDLAELKLARDQYDDALKLASRAQILAEDVKALDLLIRALTVKGNLHRFLKGGNSQKVREILNKALELSQGLSDVSVLFDLYYLLARVHHQEREFVEAGTFYGKAEAVLRRIQGRLPEDLRARYAEDRRRKVFAEDMDRFRKESHGRLAGSESRERGTASTEIRERPLVLADYKDILSRVLRIHTAMPQLGYHQRILDEGLELLSAERGLLLCVQNRRYLPLAVRGFGKDPQQNREFSAASQLAEDAIRRGKSIVSAGAADAARVPQVAALADRALIVVPLMTADRIFGGLYLDKPLALGSFQAREQALMECLAQHAGAALRNRRQLEVAIREPLTGFYTPSYFIERLREEYRLFNLHGKGFCLAGFYLPVLEDLSSESGGLSEMLTNSISDALPPHHGAVCWGNPVLYVLLHGADAASAEEVASRIKAKLAEHLKEEVLAQVLPVESRYQQGSEMYFELRRLLLPEECDQATLADLRRLLARDITLKEAKKILEKHIIENTLRKTGGNITHAARELGIHRPQLSNYLKKYGLKREIYERELDRGMNPLEN